MSTFFGTGCRLAGVVPGSPAEREGMQEGDIIGKAGEQRVTDLKSFSEVLEALEAEEDVDLTFMRDGERRMVTFEAVERCGASSGGSPTA